MGRVLLMVIGTDLRIEGSLGTVGIGTEVDIYFETKGGVAPHMTTEVLNLLPPEYAVSEVGDGRIRVLGTAATPSGDDLFTLTLLGMDADQEVVEQTFSLRVIPLPLELSGSLAAATVGTPYSDTLTIAGGVAPYNIDTSTLPAGISASILGSTITVSGTPTGAGLGAGSPKSFDVSITVEDSVTAQIVYTQTIGITVPAVVWSPTYPAGQVGAAYDYTPSAATGGTGGYSYAVTSGSVPPGLTFVGSSGRLHGTPTDDSGSPYEFDVFASDSEGNESTPAAQSVEVTTPVVYCVFGVIGPSLTLSNANRTITKASGSTWNSGRGDIGRNSGKPEFEVTFTGSAADISIGLCNTGPDYTTSTEFAGNNVSGNRDSFGYLGNPARLYRAILGAGGGFTAIAPNLVAGDIITVSVNYATDTVTWQVNGTIRRTETLTAGQTWYPLVSIRNAKSATINCGQVPLTHPLAGHDGAWTA